MLHHLSTILVTTFCSSQLTLIGWKFGTLLETATLVAVVISSLNFGLKKYVPSSLFTLVHHRDSFHVFIGQCNSPKKSCWTASKES